MNDAILPLFGFGPRPHLALDEMFVSQPDRAVSPILSGPELKEIWKELDVLLWAEFQKLTPSEWLQRHQVVSPGIFLLTRECGLRNRADAL